MTTLDMTQKDSRYNNFDFLRFLLAVLVIFSHSFALISGSNATEPLFRFSRGQMTFGDLAVDGFFVLSGFLITQSWLKSRTGTDFLVKRVRRIYPGFIGVTLLTAFILSPVILRKYPTSHDLGAILKGAVTLRGYEPVGGFQGNPIQAVNGALWSVGYEGWCYVGVALLGMPGLLKDWKPVFALFLGALLLSFGFLWYGWNPGGKILGVIFGWPKLWARMLPYFLSGMAFYLCRNRIVYSRLLTLIVAVLAIGALRIPYGVVLFWPPALAYLLFAFAFSPIPLQSWAKYGDFSYGTYLYGFPVQQTCLMLIKPSNPVLFFLLTAPVGLGLGILSWYMVEKRFLVRAKQLNKGVVLPRVDSTGSA